MASLFSLTPPTMMFKNPNNRARKLIAFPLYSKVIAKQDFFGTKIALLMRI
jgi:hypothetical protein